MFSTKEEQLMNSLIITTGKVVTTKKRNFTFIVRKSTNIEYNYCVEHTMFKFLKDVSEDKISGVKSIAYVLNDSENYQRDILMVCCVEFNYPRTFSCFDKQIPFGIELCEIYQSSIVTRSNNIKTLQQFFKFFGMLPLYYEGTNNGWIIDPTSSQ